MDETRRYWSELAHSAAKVIAEKSGVRTHNLAIVLGSGWGATVNSLGTVLAEISSDEMPGPRSTGIPGHLGKFLSIRLPEGKCALVIASRTHLYEGLGVQAVAHPIRVAAAAGATAIVLTNGAGGIRPSWRAGTPVLISDHINLTGSSPLEGATFVDLTDLYSPRLRGIAKDIDRSLDEGVYVQFRGPNYETPAEVQMAKSFGGHIVGMSTALEAIAAREAGMEILGLSLITNLAAGISAHPLSHQEVIDAGKEAEPVISALLARIVHSL